MATNSISLSASARANLLSLKDTTDALARTQNRLATGKRVNTAIDGASAFFSSQGFLNRANDFASVKENLGTALQTLNAVSNAIDAITAVVQQAQGITVSALNTTDADERTAFASQFNALLTQINSLVADATFNGVNLLSSGNLTVNFNESTAIELTVAAVNTYVGSGGLNIVAAATGWSGDAQINASVTDLSAALSTLRTTASGFGNNATLIQTRQDFTDTLINTLQVASDNLVLADENEEGANLQALQARLQLGVVSLGISGQQLQAILRLF
ncbi:MAG: flagellin [Bdellovibrionales bacterium]